MTAETELDFEFIKTALNDNDTPTSEVAITTLSNLKEKFIDQEKEIAQLKEAVKSLEEDVDSLEDDVKDEMSAFNRLNDEYKDVQEKLEDLEDSGIIPKTLYDETKQQVTARFNKNLSLEQLENLEVTVKKTFKDSGKNYIEHF